MNKPTYKFVKPNDENYIENQIKTFLFGSDEHIYDKYALTEPKGIGVVKKYFDEIYNHSNDLPFQIFLIDQFLKKQYYEQNSRIFKKKKMAEYVIVNEREELSQFFDKAIASNILVRQFQEGVECFVFSSRFTANSIYAASVTPAHYQIVCILEDFETSFVFRMNELQQEVIKEKGARKGLQQQETISTEKGSEIGVI